MTNDFYEGDVAFAETIGLAVFADPFLKGNRGVIEG
jgi:hypothetical protein